MDTPEPRPEEQDLQSRVGGVLELMRPAIKEDGGDVELVDISPDGVVKIRFLGACIGCPSSSHTLHQGIERLLKERVPEVTGVTAIEGH
ncbi:MAG: NifU family protein [Phycisphaerales bacterium]|nr:NifU family protein [Phycisphaerales bacterium]